MPEHNPSKVSSKNKGVLNMSKSQLHDFASTKRSDLPVVKKAASKMLGARLNKSRKR